jgi:hypothetical protein
MRNAIRAACAAAFLGAGAPALAAEPAAWSLGTGIHYSSGDYGTSSTTTIWSIPFAARYERGPWTLRGSIPWLRVSGPNTVIPGVGAVNNTNPRGRGRGQGGTTTTTTTGTASGIGDLVVSATYAAYYHRAGQLGIDLTGKLKAATADENEGLGTGESDAAAIVEAYKTLDRLTLLGGVGRHFLGSSTFIPLNDVWSWSLGGSYRIGERDSAGLMFDARQRVSPGAFPQRELTAFWSHKLDRDWKSQAYLLQGFADGSPDWGAGLSVLRSF